MFKEYDVVVLKKPLPDSADLVLNRTRLFRWVPKGR
jgi:hypothetical protein